MNYSMLVAALFVCVASVLQSVLLSITIIKQVKSEEWSVVTVISELSVAIMIPFWFGVLRGISTTALGG